MVPGATDWPEQSALAHQQGLEKVNIYLAAGENDEYIPFKATQEFYSKLTMSNKSMVSYKSGHSLPIDYVAPLITWFKENL